MCLLVQCSITVQPVSINSVKEGIKECDEEFLKSISDVLDRPKKFFTQYHQFNLTLEGSFRRKSSLSKKLLRTTDARMNIERLQINQLVNSCSLELEDPPACNPDEYSKGASEIAKLMRQHLGIPRGPVENLVEKIERTEISYIPPMLEDDYKAVTDEVLKQLSLPMREHFQKLFKARLEKAVELNLGMRFFETLLLETILEFEKMKVNEITEFDPNSRQLINNKVIKENWLR